MISKKIIAFSGSARKKSYNTSLLKTVTRFLKDQNLDVEFIDLEELKIPIYNGDLEETKGFPKGVEKIREILKTSDAFIVASPEYNGFFTPLLKNAIDWASRPGPDGSHSEAFKNKKAAIVSAAPGKEGGKRSLEMLRFLLNRLGVTVLDEEYSLAGAGRVTDDNRRIQDQAIIREIKNFSKIIAKKL